MRTTVTLDSDVEQILRERMAAHRLSFKQALNDAIRDGARGRIDLVFAMPTFDLGVVGDVADGEQSLTRLSGDLEDARIAEKLRAGR